MVLVGGFAFAQQPTTTEYVYEGQSPFNFNSGKSNATRSVSKGSYKDGTAQIICSGDFEISSNYTQVSCGNITGTFSSVTHTIVPETDGDIEVYPYRYTVPAYSDGPRQLFSTDPCFGGSRTRYYSGRCDLPVSAVDRTSGADIRVHTLAFESLVNEVVMCSSDDPINFNSLSYFNRLSVPKNYGNISFSISGGASSSLNNGVFDPSGLDGNFTLTASLPFLNDVATASIQISVTRIDPPNPGNTVELCQGRSINLFNGSVTQGGIWSGTGVSSDGFTFNSSSLSPGNYTVTLTVSENGCTASESKTVTVVASPSQTNFPDQTICLNNGGLQLPTSSNNVPSRNWFVFNEATSQFEVSSAIGDGFVLNPEVLGVGTHRLLYREDNSSGCRMEDEITLVINEIPEFDIGNSITLCLNDGAYDITDDIPQETLDLNGSFSFSGNFMQSGTTNFLPDVAGEGEHTITYTVTNSFGCQVSRSKNIIVTTDLTVVRSDPDGFFNTSQDTVIVHESINFRPTTNGDQFRWEFGDGGVSFQESPRYFYHTPGVYTITVTIGDPNSCSIQVIDENRIVVLEDVEGIPNVDVCEVVEFQYEEYQLNLFPNPVQDVINIDFNELPEEKIADLGMVNLVLYDINGNTILEESFEVPEDRIYVVDVATVGLQSGAIFIAHLSYGFTNVQYRLLKN